MDFKSLAGLPAKTYEKIANALHPNKSRLGEADKQKAIKRQLDDSWNNIEQTVKKDGHTGKLGESDGLIRIQPTVHKGFIIKVYGGKEYLSNLDPFGHLVWYGTAEATAEIKGINGRVFFESEQLVPKGFDDPKECLRFLAQLVELYRSPESHRKSMKLVAETIVK